MCRLDHLISTQSFLPLRVVYIELLLHCPIQCLTWLSAFLQDNTTLAFSTIFIIYQLITKPIMLVNCRKPLNFCKMHQNFPVFALATHFFQRFSAQEPFFHLILCHSILTWIAVPSTRLPKTKSKKCKTSWAACDFVLFELTNWPGILSCV